MSGLSIKYWKAAYFFLTNHERIDSVDYNYNGIMTIAVSDEELAHFYEDPAWSNGALFHCMTNQYLVLKSGDKLLGPYRWTGSTFQEIPFKTFSSSRFGLIKPKAGDPYQIAYMDSLERNQLTFCTGPAGSGKTLLALGYAFQELERGKISKIVVFCNPHVAVGAVKLGFMPGTRNEKLMESSIGSILCSKIGDRMEVEHLIANGTLELMPMGDSRGFEVPEGAFVYFSEAQNTSKYLMKLFLQRTNDTCKLCVEGDERQVDTNDFKGDNNGLQAAINLFRGEDYAGHVKLRNIYRGRIARKAEELND